ncbi:cytochrome P450 4c21-like [Armigeres subalbatus]|uniref:cytochrome P450 4c21-like n=1 Tax=Armigeres subalbatus TaxID=124917 RepID=UPI002ED23D35
MLFTILAIGAVLCLASVWSLVQKRSSFAKSISVAEPWYPLVGNGLLFVGKDDTVKFHNMKNMFDRSNKLFRFYLGPKMLFGTSDPDMAQQILTDPNCMDKPYLYDYFMLGQGVFGAKTKVWRGQRKALNPAFNTKILESFMTIFGDITRSMIQRLETIAKGETINFMEHVSRCTLEMVCATTLGFNATKLNEIEKLGYYIERNFDLAARRMLNFHLQLDCIYRWSKDYRDERALRGHLESYGMQIYDDANDRYAKGLFQSDTTELDENEGFRKPQIFVNQLFASTSRKFERDDRNR